MTATPTPTWHPPVAITTSQFLRAELQLCEQQAGTEFAYPNTIPEARRLARHTSMVIIGTDEAGRIRKPIRCPSGLVLVATVQHDDRRAVGWMQRLGAHYAVVLPTARDFVVDKLLHPSGDPNDPARRIG